MTAFDFNDSLWLPRPRGEVFAFFSDALNLEEITPPWVQFEVLAPQPITIHEGATIDYRLKIHGIPVRWKTRINSWNPPHSFVDEQVRGPYTLWIHTHSFEEQDGGTLMRDHVRYAVPGGWLIHSLFVRHDIEKIFAFRKRKMMDCFG